MSGVSATESTVLLDLLFEDPAVGRCLVAPDGNILRANAEWLRSAGLTLEDALGADIVELFPETREMALALHARARAGRRVEVPRHAQRLHGRETWWETSIAPVPMVGGTGLLITARQVGGSEPREEAEGLRTLVEMMPLGVVEWDSQYRVTRFSRRAEQLFGWSADEVIGRRIDEIPWVPEEDWPSVRAVMRDMSSGARPANVNTNRNVRKDGTVVYCEWYNATVHDAAGRLVSVLSLVLDVTARTRAEDALREQEKKYRSLFENSLDAVYLTRQDGTILDANQAACRMHGMTLEEIKQRGRAGLVVNDERHAAALKARAATGQVRAEMTDLRKDGTRFPVEVESVVVDPTLPAGAAFVIARDITERKRAHEALRQSEERFRRTVVSAPFPIMIRAEDGRVVLVNDVWRQITGYAPEEIPTVQAWAERAYGDEKDAVLRTIREHDARDEPLVGEHRVRTRDGRTRLWSFAVSPLGLVGGVKLFAAMAVDVTEQRAAEEALREADRRKNEFLAVLSHELRNPLAPIRNSVYLLERAPPGSEQAARAKDVVRRQTEHLTRLVDDLLDITRISRGKISLQRTRVDLREIVRKTTDDLLSVFAEAGVELRVEHATLGPAWIDADPMRIAQVLGNLLQNSVKFTPSGGSVAVTVAARDRRAELCVRDDGAGMDPATVEHMFEPFAQATQTLARTTGGLGLGLALVKGIVEMHGGSVHASSEGLGRGAMFRVDLPLVEAGVDPEGRAASQQPGGKLVLVIEDNVDAGQSLAEILRLHGHRVFLARDGRSGLALARELRPEVILCDLGLPDLDGYEIASALRSDEAHRATRLIALSGYAQSEDRQRARDAGFDAHIAKPPDLDALMSEVASDGPFADA